MTSVTEIFFARYPFQQPTLEMLPLVLLVMYLPWIVWKSTVPLTKVCASHDWCLPLEPKTNLYLTKGLGPTQHGKS